MREPRPRGTGREADGHFAESKVIGEDPSPAASLQAPHIQTRGWLAAPGHLIWIMILVAIIALGGWLAVSLHGSSAARPGGGATATKGGGLDRANTEPPGPGGATANSSCSPTTDAATSGGSPAHLMSTATKVASGSTDGQSWSLWSAKGQSGATALEDGGLVFAGLEYGLCPGYPNPSETEMLDVGSKAVIYGVVGYPGLAKVDLSIGTIGSFASGKALPSPRVQVVNGVSFYIGVLPDSACAYRSLEVKTTSPGVSAEHNLGFATAGAGQGTFIADNPGNSGGCVANRIDPISFSQGIWALPPGQFQAGFSNEPGPGGATANSSCSPTTDAATSGGSPAHLMSTATKVASGSTDGQSWSLWSAKGQSGATALEDGGLVFAGLEYGLCPGYPNPSETEMLDVGSKAVIYGVVGYPGLAKVDLSIGTIGSFDFGKALPSPRVQVVNGVSFYIGVLPDSACAYRSLELKTTSPGVSAEHNLGFATAGAGQGTFIADNPGNSGGCVANRIDPISFSQGIWQLPPGQFPANFSNEPGPLAGRLPTRPAHRPPTRPPPAVRPRT